MTYWHILPFEILQLIFTQFTTIELIKLDILVSFYSCDELLRSTLHSIWSKRPDKFSKIMRLKNKTLFKTMTKDYQSTQRLTNLTLKIIS